MAKRRGNGEGSVRQRGDNWEATVMVGYKMDGRRDIRSFYGNTRAEALRKMRAFLDARERGVDTDTDYTLSEWIEIFMVIHSANIKPVTVENYKYTIKLINCHLGAKKMRLIKPYDIEVLLLRLKEEGRSDSALSQVRGFLYMAQESAVGNDLILKNPVQYAKKLRKRPPNEKEVFSEEEYRLLMKALPDDLIGHSVRLLLLTGMRCQELLALTPEHIEPDGSKIYIKQAVSMIRGTVSISTPKSWDSMRTIVVPSIGKESAIYLRSTANKYVFQSPAKDLPINPSTFRKLYKRCLESIPGVHYLPVHNCRHSYVSLMQAKGVDMATIQSLVGHSTVKMTLHYTHVHESVQNEAVEKLSSILGG